MKIIDWCIHLIVIGSALIVTLFFGNFDDLRAEDIGSTNPMIDTTHRFTDVELDNLEKNLKSDPRYHWKFLLGDRKKVISLILAAQKRKPTNPVWYYLIDMCFASDQYDAKFLPVEDRRARYRYALRYLQKSSQILQTALEVSVDKKVLKPFVSSQNMNIAIASLEVGDITSAKRLAEGIVRNNSNHHEANTVLGRVALREDDPKTAKIYLLKSAKTPGSPQLRSFGPNFSLARELLEKGEKSAVLEYLDMVGKFWANPENVDWSNHNSVRVVQEHAEQLSKWKNEIIKGNIPQDGRWRERLTKFYFKTDPAKPEFWQITSEDFPRESWRQSSITDKGLNLLSCESKLLFAPDKPIEGFSVHGAELRFNSLGQLIAVYINILNEGDFFPYKKSHEFNYKIASSKTLAKLSVSRQKQQEDRQRKRMLFPRLDKKFKKTYSTKQKAIIHWLDTNYGRHTESFGKFSSDLGSERCQTWATKGTIFNLYSVKDTYILLELLPREKKINQVERTNLPKKKHSIKDNVEHLANGDVIIRNIPLVEQGHKGYCAVATVEMVLRYFGCEVSNTQLATLAGYSQGEPGAGLINALSRVVTGKAKLNFRIEPIFIARTARERVSQGEPFIVWRYFDRIRDRQISSHSKAVTRNTTIPPMKITGKELMYFQKMKTGGSHASVVVGFNKQRDEFLLSESWNVYSTLKRFQRKELEATCHRVLIFHPTSPYILGQPQN